MGLLNTIIIIIIIYMQNASFLLETTNVLIIINRCGLPCLMLNTVKPYNIIRNCRHLVTYSKP